MPGDDAIPEENPGAGEEALDRLARVASTFATFENVAGRGTLTGVDTTRLTDAFVHKSLIW